MANETENNQQAANGNQPEGYITKEEVAKRLKKTVRTVENWQRRGILPFIKAGRSVLFKWSDCEAHLQQNFRVCKPTITK
jgi:excisionase family DNA binding protein